MKRVYELDVYKLAEELSDMIWYDFDKWNKKVQNTVGYQIVRSSDSIAANICSRGLRLFEGVVEGEGACPGAVGPGGTHRLGDDTVLVEDHAVGAETADVDSGGNDHDEATL